VPRQRGKRRKRPAGVHIEKGQNPTYATEYKSLNSRRENDSRTAVFGDDALKFELRFFVEFGQGLSTKHEIHVSIDRTFQEEGIKFATPSLDIKVPGPALPPPAPAPRAR